MGDKVRLDFFRDLLIVFRGVLVGSKVDDSRVPFQVKISHLSSNEPEIQSRSINREGVQVTLTTKDMMCWIGEPCVLFLVKRHKNKKFSFFSLSLSMLIINLKAY